MNPAKEKKSTALRCLGRSLSWHMILELVTFCLGCFRDGLQLATLTLQNIGGNNMQRMTVVNPLLYTRLTEKAHSLEWDIYPCRAKFGVAPRGAVVEIQNSAP